MEIFDITFLEEANRLMLLVPPHMIDKGIVARKGVISVWIEVNHE